MSRNIPNFYKPRRCAKSYDSLSLSLSGISFLWKLGWARQPITHGAPAGRQAKSNFMGGTLNFSFQDAPMKQKMGEEVSFYSVQTPRFPTWPRKTPPDIRACLCASWTDSLVCRAALVRPLGLTCCLCEPHPWARSCGCPCPAWGVGLPETLSRSALGPSQFTHHTLLLGKLA